MNAKQISDALDAIVKNPELLRLVNTDIANDASELLWDLYCARIEDEITADEYVRVADTLEEAIEDLFGI